MKRASSVTLSRIAGYKYPNDEVEKKSLLTYFSAPQGVSINDVIITINGSLESHSNYYDPSYVEDDNTFNLYCVTDIILVAENQDVNYSYIDGIEYSNGKEKVTGCDSTEYIEDDNIGGNNTTIDEGKACVENQSIESAVRMYSHSLSTINKPSMNLVITVVDITTIGLKGRVNCIVPNMRSIGDFIDDYRRKKCEFHLPNNSQIGSWIQIRNFLEPSIIQLYEVFCPVLNIAFAVSCNDNNGIAMNDYRNDYNLTNMKRNLPHSTDNDIRKNRKNNNNNINNSNNDNNNNNNHDNNNYYYHNNSNSNTNNDDYDIDDHNKNYNSNDSRYDNNNNNNDSSDDNNNNNNDSDDDNKNNRNNNFNNHNNNNNNNNNGGSGHNDRQIDNRLFSEKYSVSDGALFNLIKSPLLIESACGEDGK